MLLVVVFPILAIAIAHAEKKRPNILIAFADDWGRYASAYAQVDGKPSPNQIVQTPNFDRIAREGALFKNAFVTAPSCTPCRSSLLSGQYFWRTGRGAILQGAVWDPTIPSFPLLLRDSGYHIGKTFKVWSPGTPADAPYGADQHAYEKAGRRFNRFSQQATGMIKEGKSFEAAKELLLNEVKGNFESFLKERKPGQPFCYWFGPTQVHRKWVQGSGKALWGIDPDSLKGKLPKFMPDVPEVREDFADYLGEVQAFDAALGVLLAQLEEMGELESTLILVAGDHGPPGFPNGKCTLYDFGTATALAVRGPGLPGGRVLEDFVNLMDLAPTFLEFGDVAIPDVMTGRSLVKVLKSKSSGLVDPNRSWVVTGRERHVAAARDGNLPYPQRAIRTQDYLYILNFEPDRWPLGNPYNLQQDSAPTYQALRENTMVTFMDMDAGPTKAWLVAHRNDSDWAWHYNVAFGKRPGEELYVLAKDPDQINNVADDPGFAELRSELRARLLKELRVTNDPRVSKDPVPFEHAPFAGK